MFCLSFFVLLYVVNAFKACCVAPPQYRSTLRSLLLLVVSPNLDVPLCCVLDEIYRFNIVYLTENQTIIMFTFFFGCLLCIASLHSQGGYHTQV